MWYDKIRIFLIYVYLWVLSTQKVDVIYILQHFMNNLHAIHDETPFLCSPLFLADHNAQYSWVIAE